VFPDNRDGRRIDPSSSDAFISYYCTECLGKNPSKEYLACDRDTDERDETNKKSPRPQVAEPMHRNQKMDLNRVIDTCLRTIESGDTSSRDSGPVLLRLQGQDRDQPNTQGIKTIRIKSYIGIQVVLYRTTQRSHPFRQELLCRQ